MDVGILSPFEASPKGAPARLTLLTGGGTPSFERYDYPEDEQEKGASKFSAIIFGSFNISITPYKGIIVVLLC